MTLIHRDREIRYRSNSSLQTLPVDIFIFQSGNNIFASILVWDIYGVTSGEWTWTRPSDQDYHVEIRNPNSEDVVVDIEIEEGPNALKSKLLDIITISIICAVCFLYLMMIIVGTTLILIFFVNKKESH
jgi:hypothetical protein